MPKILDFKRSEKPFQIRSKSPTSSEITIYSPIGDSMWEDSLSAKQFSEELKSVGEGVKEITVRINSPGGSVFDGITIYNRLKQHKAKIIVHIDGLAASIASIIALAGDEVHMGEGAILMVHLPWTGVLGNRNDLENTINRLMDIEEQMISIYAKKTGLDRQEIRAMLEAETWLDADQAIEKGFVDFKSTESLAIAASAFDHKWINKRPKTFKSMDKVISAEIDNLKLKLKKKLARK
jgi:ATP-dependent Clp endopeptidase proteolytic subunit ClpP